MAFFKGSCYSVINSLLIRGSINGSIILRIEDIFIRYLLNVSFGQSINFILSLDSDLV